MTNKCFSAGIWYTSGEALPGIDAVKWNGDGTYTNHSTSVYWNSPADYAILYMHVVYKYSGTFKWPCGDHFLLLHWKLNMKYHLTMIVCLFVFKL